VLVSYAGDRKGHVLVLHATTDGPRWADPAGGVVAEGRRPAALGGAVAAWAVMADPDGRVAEPGAWSAPESAGALGMLTDPPLRHDFGAMEVQAQRHNVRLFRPGGQPLPEKAVLLRSRDGLVKVVVHNGTDWLGQDGLLHKSETGPGMSRKQTWVPEIVGLPSRALAEPGRPGQDAVLARIRAVDRRLNQATTIGAQQRGKPLAELFPKSEYQIDPAFGDVRAVRLDGLIDLAPLFAQVSVGVPLGGGVLAVLRELRFGMNRESHRYYVQALTAAARFGWGVARLYMADTTGDELSAEQAQALTTDWDVVAVAEVMALAFVQLTSVLGDEADPALRTRSWMVVVPRQTLHQIWGELGLAVQGFFASRAGDIRRVFAAEFAELLPGFNRHYNTARGRRLGASVDLWDVDFSDLDTGVRIGTVGQLFDEILRPAPVGPRIGPGVFDVGPADSGGLDRSRGSGPDLPLPLVVLEMRRLARPMRDGREGRGTWGDIDHSMIEDIIGRLAGVASDGDAAAEFARQMSASPQGRKVTVSLRKVAAALPGTRERNNAFGKLLWAVSLYKESFPVQRPELEQALRPAAEWLGLSPLAQAPAHEIASSARVRALLGAGHQVPPVQIAKVVLLARSLGMPAGGEARWLAGLARDVGLDHQDPRWGRVQHLIVRENVTRAFGLLALATSVFGDGLGCAACGG
jgi:hypothetical protein